MRNNITIATVLSLALTACAAGPSPVGGDCELGCESGTECLPVSVSTAVCTLECSADPAVCPADSVCIDTPEPGSYCLALCAEDGTCEAGDPGFPIRDADGNVLDTCVCIPWSQS